MGDQVQTYEDVTEGAVFSIPSGLQAMHLMLSQLDMESSESGPVSSERVRRVVEAGMSLDSAQKCQGSPSRSLSRPYLAMVFEASQRTRRGLARLGTDEIERVAPRRAEIF